MGNNRKECIPFPNGITHVSGSDIPEFMRKLIPNISTVGINPDGSINGYAVEVSKEKPAIIPLVDKLL